MKRLFIIISLFLLSATVTMASKDKTSSQILSRMFAFQENHNPQVKDKTMQAYTKNYYETYRRNLLLWLIPSMYTIAGGERKFMSERYEQITFKDANTINRKRQVYYTTIPRNRSTMSVLDNFDTPNLYNTTLYGKYVLSPFCKENRLFYQYKVSQRSNGQSRIDFRPRLSTNVQLVSGTAIVNTKTGRITNVVIMGEYDGIDFKTTIKQGSARDTLAMPSNVKTEVDFKFLGNHIASTFSSVYNSPVQLPDTVDVTGDRKLISKLRPISLSKNERAVYASYDSLNNVKPDTTSTDSVSEVNKKLQSIKELGWDVGSYLMSSHGKSSEKYHIRLSPLIEPQYISYSHSRGFSYKMKLAADYYCNENSGLHFNATLGYNFKIKQFYLYAPLRYVYNKKRDNYLELSWDLGNRVGNSAVIDELKDELGELPELDEINLDEFNDNKLKLSNFTRLNSWLRLELGVVYHRRTAVNRYDMQRFNKPDVYQSLAPSIGLHIKPWAKGPNLSINYERSITSKIFDLDYERWEASASKIFKLPSTRQINMQTGAGLYTRRHSNNFMDFANFCVNNLPGGWDDDWTGDFQLLDSKLYNISHYYVSCNVSYETPMILAPFVPFLGKYVERERLYWSGLSIEYTRPYFELGYGFTTRFFSAALFTSFYELNLMQVGTKFTIELFRKW